MKKAFIFVAFLVLVAGLVAYSQNIGGANSAGQLNLPAAGGLTVLSPVINGTPTGTGIVTRVTKTGSGTPNYNNTNLTFANVDTTNLCLAKLVPVGWKFEATATNIVIAQATATNSIDVSLADIGTSCAGAGVTPLPGAQSHFDIVVANAYLISASLHGEVIGDGAIHSISLQALTGNPADAWYINNSSSTRTPNIEFILEPSN